MNFRTLTAGTVAAALAALALVAGPTRAQAPVLTPVRAAYIPVITWLPALTLAYLLTSAAILQPLPRVIVIGACMVLMTILRLSVGTFFWMALGMSALAVAFTSTIKPEWTVSTTGSYRAAPPAGSATFR